jgi:sterol desaturase/sphingolipid hydroxylase (fatty acid hydroxylase superfamily)
VTMSSSVYSFFIFPINFTVAKVVSLAYMVFAVLVHWDAFARFDAYHLNHHYSVTKNYGSHFPIFDIFFGTYEWDSAKPRLRFLNQVEPLSEKPNNKNN